MPEQPTQHLLEVEQIGDVTVARFVRRTLLESEAIEAVKDRLLALMGEEGRRKLVVNFARVESLTSAMLGAFVSLEQTVKARDGRLAFCQVDPFLMQIFKIFKIPELIRIFGDEQEAVQQV